MKQKISIWLTGRELCLLSFRRSSFLNLPQSNVQKARVPPKSGTNNIQQYMDPKKKTEVSNCEYMMWIQWIQVSLPHAGWAFIPSGLIIIFFFFPFHCITLHSDLRSLTTDHLSEQAMVDSEGRKIIVCDNGTGVSSAVCCVAWSHVIMSACVVTTTVRKMWICWLFGIQFPISYLSIAGWSTYHSSCSANRWYWSPGMCWDES